MEDTWEPGTNPCPIRGGKYHCPQTQEQAGFAYSSPPPRAASRHYKGPTLPSGGCSSSTNCQNVPDTLSACLLILSLGTTISSFALYSMNPLCLTTRQTEVLPSTQPKTNFSNFEMRVRQMLSPRMSIGHKPYTWSWETLQCLWGGNLVPAYQIPVHLWPWMFCTHNASDAGPTP